VGSDSRNEKGVQTAGNCHPLAVTSSNVNLKQPAASSWPVWLYRADTGVEVKGHLLGTAWWHGAFVSTNYEILVESIGRVDCVSP
jgi:hypothetical protein